MKTERKTAVSERLRGLLRSLKDPEKRFSAWNFTSMNPEKYPDYLSKADMAE